MDSYLTNLLWIVPLTVFFIIEVVNGTFISLHHNHLNWSEAVQTCHSKGGTLANFNQVIEAVKKCSNHTKEFDAIWTSNISIGTPLLSIVGCYKSSGISTRNCSRRKSIPSCYIHCDSHGFDYFGLSGYWCHCLSNLTEVEESRRKKATFCQKTRQNSEEYMIIYRRAQAKESRKLINAGQSNMLLYSVSACRHVGLEGKLYIIEDNKTGKHDNMFYPACRDLNNRTVSVLNDTYSDWQQANDACIQITGDYLYDEIPSSKINHTCHYLNRTSGISNFIHTATLWSSKRTYVSAYDMKEYLDKNTSLDNIICRIANTSNAPPVSINQTCSEGHYGFFCISDEPLSSICHLELKKDSQFSVHLSLVVIFPSVAFIYVLGFLLRKWSNTRRSTKMEITESTPEQADYDYIGDMEPSEVWDSEDMTVYNHTISYIQKLNENKTYYNL